MRILVIGASGLVGSHVLAEGAVQGHEVAGTYRNHPVDGLFPLDLSDRDATRTLLARIKPDWVVHAAGWTWVDGCEKDPARAMRENCDQPSMLARLCVEAGCRFAYFSTTYVFDGKSGPYGENDAPNPINVYATTKWKAEQQIQDICSGRALIPRVICVWGKELQKKNFVYQVVEAVRVGRTMRIPSDQEGNPTWAGDIAWWLMQLLVEGESGIWNLVGEPPNCLREQWLRLILSGISADVQELKASIKDWHYEIIPTARLGQPALRPLKCGGRSDKIRSRFPRTTTSPSDISIIY